MKKIAFINGSPKKKKSASAFLLETLKGYLPPQISVFDVSFSSPNPRVEDIQQLLTCDALVFAFPLYVDGIPSHLLHSLMILEQAFKNASIQDKAVYVILNCGFYEGRQNATALPMMKNWCAKCQLSWGQGLGVGAGGMLLAIAKSPMEKKLTKNLRRALRVLARHVVFLQEADPLYVHPNLPRIFYQIAGKHSWQKGIKKNGLAVKDLFAQPGKM